MQAMEPNTAVQTNWQVLGQTGLWSDGVNTEGKWWRF